MRLSYYYSELLLYSVYLLLVFFCYSVLVLSYAAYIVEYTSYYWLCMDIKYLSYTDPLMFDVLLTLYLIMHVLMLYLIFYSVCYMCPSLYVHELLSILYACCGYILMYAIGIVLYLSIVMPIFIRYSLSNEGLTDSVHLLSLWQVLVYMSMFSIVIVVLCYSVSICKLSWLCKHRLMFWYVLMVVTCMITPPDVVSSSLIIVLLVVLYECYVLMRLWLH